MPSHHESLLAQVGWVQALARSLVSDPHVADDLAQETWAAALERPPAASGTPSLRAWLARVVRNFARQRARGDDARRGRETRVTREATRARAEAPADGGLIERAGAHRAVVEAVLDLDEPYRTTLLMRFFDELPPREIARRLGLTVAAVDSRLARGLTRLRERLARELGDGAPDGRAWLLALFPLAERAPSASATTLGVLVMSVTIKLAAAALVLAAGVVAYRWSGDDGAPVADAVAAEPVPESTPAPAVLPPPVRGGEDARRPAPTRDAPEPAAPEPRATPAAAPLPELAVGRVLDSTGHPVAGLEVRFVGGAPTPGEPTPAEAEPADGEPARTAVTGSDGRFRLPARGRRGRIGVVDESWVTVLEGNFLPRPGEPEELVLVAAPLQPLGGTVLDRAGVAVEGALVRIELPSDFRSRFDAVLERASDRVWVARSDADGRFELEHAARIRGARLTVRHDAYAPLDRPLPEFADPALQLVLTEHDLADGALRGQVVDPAGRPVAGARLALGAATGVSAVDGTFALPLDRAYPEGRAFPGADELDTPVLRAVKPGYLPGILEAPPELAEQLEAEDGDARVPSFVVVELGGPPLALAGTLVDGDGVPVEGGFVWIGDPTLFGVSDRTPLQVETILADVADRFWHRVRTDAEGRFAIEGLLDREYRLVAMQPGGFLRTELEGVRAGRADVELQLPDDGLYERVAGRVVTRGGVPVAGARVSLRTSVFASADRRHVIGSVGTETDAEGRFELRGVPHRFSTLSVEGEGLASTSFGTEEEGWIEGATGGRVEDVEIVVAGRCQFHVELREPAEADGVGVVDDVGDELMLTMRRGEQRVVTNRAPLSAAGRSDVLAVSESARELVLWKDGAEVRRVELRLSPAERSVVRP